MADFRGFRCDNCGDIGEDKDRVKRTVTVAVKGDEYEKVEDFCSKCGDDKLSETGLKLKPKKAAKSTKKAAQQQEPVRSG